MEPTANPTVRYSRGAIALHWIIAILIMANFAIAWRAEDLPKEEAFAVMGYHKAVGMLVLLFTVLRIVWRFTNRPPPLVETLKSWEAAIAKVTHGLFYFLMLAVPIAGWGLHSSFVKMPVGIFGLFGIPALPVGQDKPTQGMFHELHEVFATLMLVLLVLHILAALKHQFIDRDGTLRRMLPFLK